MFSHRVGHDWSDLAAAAADVFLELSCFFDDPADVGNLISRSSAFSKTSLNIWKFTVHILLKPCLENFEHYFAGVWDECNCAVVWAFFGIAFLWVWNEDWPFPVLWSLLSFPNLLAGWVKTDLEGLKQLLWRGSIWLGSLWEGNTQNSPSQASATRELWPSRCSSWF